MEDHGVKRWLAAASLALVVPLLGACSVDDGQLQDAVGSLPGVVRAHSSCGGLACDVQVELSPDVQVEQVRTVLAAARTVDRARDVELSVPESPGSSGGWVKLHTDRRSPDRDDAALAALLVHGASTAGVAGLQIHHSGARGVVEVALEAPVWDRVETWWELTAALPDPSLELYDARPPRQLVRLSSPPDETALALARTTSGEPGVTGVAVDDRRLVVATTTQRRAEELRRHLTRRPGSDGLEVVAAASDGLLVLVNTTPAQLQTATGLMLALEEDTAVRRSGLSRKDGELVVEVDDYAAAAAAVRRLQRQDLLPPDLTVLFQQAEVRSTPSLASGVEVVAGGDDAVLDLGAALVRKWPDAVLRVSQHLEADAPAQVGVALQLSAPDADHDADQGADQGADPGSAPDLAPYVRALGGLLREVPGEADRYRLSVEVAGSQGRSSTIAWVVDRAGGRWTVGEVDGTEEGAALVRDAWGTRGP